MLRLLVPALTFLAVLTSSALAQMMTTVPGPGGIPLAPGSPVPGYTPGGIGPGGIEVAPGPAARNVPMFRVGPGGVLFPPRPDPRRDPDGLTVRLDPGCDRPDHCVPELMPQSLLLTITSRDSGPGKSPSPDAAIDSIADLFATLRTCWEPPPREQAREGLQMSVRFSFKRTGEIIAPPFVTYTTPGTETDVKQVYRSAITTALDRCKPLRFSEGFSGAIAGRPISVRYIDDRALNVGSQHR